MIYLKTGERIRELRMSSGMTQADLARRMHVTRSSVNAWELGLSTPNIQNLIELADLFRTSTDYVLGLSKGNKIDISIYNVDEQELLLRMVRYFDKLRHPELHKKPETELPD